MMPASLRLTISLTFTPVVASKYQDSDEITARKCKILLPSRMLSKLVRKDLFVSFANIFSLFFPSTGCIQGNVPVCLSE